MNRTIAAIAVATVCLHGCASRAARATDDDARAYVRLALAVGVRDPDSLGFYAGPPEWRIAAERAYRPLADVRRDLAALAGRLRTRAGATDDRALFLGAQIDALIARIDLLGGARWPFADEARRLFDVRIARPDLHDAAAARAALAQRLGGPDELFSRYAHHVEQRLVPRNRIRAVFEEALAVCREQTRRHLPLPDDESVLVEDAATASPWPAFTTYTGQHRSLIAINTTFAFTADDLKELACHEGYPGHHAIYVWRDDALVRTGRVELVVEPLFSPQAFLDEAAASFAPALVGGADRDDVQTLARRLDPIRLDIVWRYVDGDLEFARAAAALTDEALTPAAPVLKFVNEFRSYAATYTAGRAMVARIVEAGTTVDARWQKYRALVVRGRM